MFHHCPGFKELRGDHPEDEIQEAEINRLTTKEFKKQVEKYDEREKAIKMRRKSAKRDPSIKEIRKRIQEIIKFHVQKANEMLPSIYPILGPVNLDDEEGGEGNGGSKRGGLKMANTKGELKRYGN